MTAIHAISVRTTARPSRGDLPLFFIPIFAIALCVFTIPVTAQAKNSAKDKTTATTAPTKKKGVSKITYQRSSSEESRSERDRRMYRECRGMHNAGACRGFTRP